MMKTKTSYCGAEYVTRSSCVFVSYKRVPQNTEYRFVAGSAAQLFLADIFFFDCTNKNKRKQGIAQIGFKSSPTCGNQNNLWIQKKPLGLYYIIDYNFAHSAYSRLIRHNNSSLRILRHK